MEHCIAPEPVKSVAVNTSSPFSVSTPLPGVTIRIVGSTVKVVVPETPVLSTAVTVAVPAGAEARA